MNPAMNPAQHPAGPELREIPTRLNPNPTSIPRPCGQTLPVFLEPHGRQKLTPPEPGETQVSNFVNALRLGRDPVPVDDFLPQLWSSNHTAIRKIPETMRAFDQSHYGRAIAPNVSFSTNVLDEITVRRRVCILCVPMLAFAATSTAPQQAVRPVRATGIIRAVHSVTVLVPFIESQGGNLSLATLAENGALVNVGDSLATFDRANELKLLRDAQTKLEDLARQIEEKKAEHLSNAEKRIADLQQAEADLKKAEIESRKGPVLRVRNKITFPYLNVLAYSGRDDRPLRNRAAF